MLGLLQWSLSKGDIHNPFQPHTYQLLYLPALGSCGMSQGCLASSLPQVPSTSLLDYPKDPQGSSALFTPVSPESATPCHYLAIL